MGPLQVSVNEYVPKLQTKVKASEVLQTLFPAIDAHNHFNNRYNPEDVIAAMDVCNIKVFVDLSGGHGDSLKRKLELLKGSFPDRFAVYTTPDLSKATEKGFADRVARELEDAVRAGAQGLKIFKSLGLNLRDENGKLFHVDDERFAPLWEAAGHLEIPVVIHVADPPAFFEPLDKHNERYAQLVLHPDWHFHGKDYPSFQQLIEERNRLLERHPRTTFIGAHVGSESEDLASAGMLLDAYPNYNVDLSARAAEIGRKPRQSREFILRYQDRIVFGTDQAPTPEIYRIWFRLLESHDECFEYPGWPKKGFWHISGLGLPENVLKKVYVTNALRLIPGTTEMLPKNH